MLPTINFLVIVSIFTFASRSCAFTLKNSRSAVANFSRMQSLRSSKVDDKAEVKEYFDNEGFSRWNKIYSDSDEVNVVQKNIRDGHQQTIDKVSRKFLIIIKSINIARILICLKY